MRTLNILVAQEGETQPGLADLLRREAGTAVTRCSSPAEVHSVLRQTGFDLLVVDLRRPQGDFPALAAAFRQACPSGTVLVAAGEATAPMAVEALRNGACHFVVRAESDDELRSMVHRVTRGQPNGGDGPSPQRGPSTAPTGDGRPTLYEMERSYILRTLEECRWNKKRTASVLGINRSSLYSKIKRFGIGDESMN